MLRREVLRSLMGAAGLDRSAPTGVVLVQTLAEECIAGGSLDAADRLLAPQYRCHGSFGEMNRDEWKRAVAWLHDNVSSLRVAIHETVAARDRVTARWTLSGTERASRRPFRLDGISIERVTSDRILESHIAADTLPCLRSLGLARELESV